MELGYRDLEAVYAAAREVIRLRPDGSILEFHNAMNELQAQVKRLEKKERKAVAAHVE